MLAGLVQLGQFFRAISPSVIHGMLAGIGVLIFASQFHIMVDDRPRGSGIANVLSIPEALLKAFTFREGTTHHIAAAIGLLTIVTLLAWTSLKPVSLRMVPGTLVAVVVASISAALLGLRMNYVDVPGNLLESVSIPTMEQIFRVLTNQELAFAAIALAFIASAETLLCASAVDQMHSGPRADFNRELFAQGVGNMICGGLGALPMTGVIVRSTANTEAGAQTRLSAIFHGVWLLALVAAAPGILRTIPTAALAAILVYTGYKLINPSKIRKLAKFGRGEVIVYSATLIGIVTIDLLTGVIIGFALALLKLLYTVSQLKVYVIHQPDRVDIHLEGAATFIGLPKLAKALEALPPGPERHIHFHNLNYIDHACLDLIISFKTQQEKVGSKVIVELDQLESRYWRPTRGTSPIPASSTTVTVQSAKSS
jgi:MFS superfamily sulfate permease-like transporter